MRPAPGLRSAVTALGATVVLATFAPGIHWLADIIAGVAVGMISVAVAWRVTDTSERGEYALHSELPVIRGRRRPIPQLAPAAGFADVFPFRRPSVSAR